MASTFDIVPFSFQKCVLLQLMIEHKCLSSLSMLYEKGQKHAFCCNILFPNGHRRVEVQSRFLSFEVDVVLVTWWPQSRMALESKAKLLFFHCFLRDLPKRTQRRLQRRRGFLYFEATRPFVMNDGLLEGVVLVADLDRLLYRPAEQLGLDVDEVVVVVGSSLIRGDGGDGEPQVRALVVVLVKHTG